MKILFDFLTIACKNGAAEYTRRVFYALLDRVKKENLRDVRIFCLYDSKALPAYDDLCLENLKCDFICFVDYQLGASAIKEQNFDVFFLACAHTAGWHPEISRYECKSIIVVHDCVWEEMYNNDVSIYLALNGNDMYRYRETKPRGKKIYWDIKSPTIRFCRWLLHCREHGILESDSKMLQTSISLFHNRHDNEIVTVSNYSKNSLMYNFNLQEEKICVKYSPERVYQDFVNKNGIAKNERLRLLIGSKSKYYLIVSAGRENKNAIKALRAFRAFSEIRNDAFIVTIGFKKELYNNHIDLPFLDDMDLREAYKHCYALIYPSFFEGFGYPPLEAMKYGKPVLSSNVCSMPEVLGDAPIYFSPIYESAIFNALLSLDDENYEYHSRKSLRQYEIVSKRQAEDLVSLVDQLLHFD